MLEIIRFENRKDRPEDLFLRYSRFRIHTCYYRWLDEETVARLFQFISACNNSPLFFAYIYIAQDRVVGRLTNNRTHIVGEICCRTHTESLCLGGNQFKYLVVDILYNNS